MPIPSRDQIAERVDRALILASIATAARRVSAEPPFSPSWDAAMAALEDAERALWRLDEVPSTGVSHGAAIAEPVAG